MGDDILQTWTEAGEHDRRVAGVREKQVARLAAKRVLPQRYSRASLYQALSDGRPIVFSDFRVPVSNEAPVREALPQLIRSGFEEGQRARVQVGPARRRSTLPVPEVMRRWEGRRAIISVTDLHVRGHEIESKIGVGPLSDFNVLLCGSEAMANQEMMTMVIGARGNVTDSHSDDPDGSNHCFFGRKLWLAWDTFEGQAAGLEDNSRDLCDGYAKFDFEAFLSLRTSLWWTVSTGETLFLPGHLTHRVITLDHYIGIGSFFVALPSAVQTLARWNVHGALWALRGQKDKLGLVDEIAVTTARKVRELQRGPEPAQRHWGLPYLRAAAERWRATTPRTARERLLRNEPFAELMRAATA